jgi:hypothetical protein
MVEGDLHPSPGTSFTQKHYVFFGLVDKVFVTHDAIIHLAEQGYADDGFSLVRTSVEAIINGAYILHIGGDAAAADYADFHKYRDWVELKEVEKIMPESVKSIPAERLAQMEKDHEQVKDRYKGSDWTTLKLPDRALAIDKAVGEDFYQMRFLYNTPWRHASHHVHGNAKSIQSRFEEKNGKVCIHRRFTKEEAAFLLDTANIVMFAEAAILDVGLGVKFKKQYDELQEEWLGKAPAQGQGG